MEKINPKISVLVVVYRMSRQAENTLRSLSPSYQQGASASDYEIIVVENNSDNELGRERTERIAPNIRYYYNKETGVSPVPALSMAAQKARGHILGAVIDGARMVTPGVMRFTKKAFRMRNDALVAVPSYHLGAQEHHTVTNPQIHTDREKKLLAAIDWQQDGYRLFDIACWSSMSPSGYLDFLYESNCLFFPRYALDAIGGFDERFSMKGGGSVNQALYAQLSARPSARLFMLGGEGSFHQYHGGVTTSGGTARSERERMVASLAAQHKKITGKAYSAINREPILLGSFPSPTRHFLEHSAHYNHFVSKIAHKERWVRYPLDSD